MQSYGGDESVGAWVLNSQQYAKTEPVYAVCAKQVNAPPNSIIKKVPMPVAPPVVLREPTPPTNLNLMTNNQINYPPHNNGGYVSHIENNQNYPPHHMSHMRHCPQPPRNLLISNSNTTAIIAGKRAPPPPRRSETTHLSTT